MQHVGVVRTELTLATGTSGGVSHPTGDAVSSGADSSIEASADAIGRSKGTEGGFGGNLGAGEQEIIRDATTSNIP